MTVSPSDRDLHDKIHLNPVHMVLRLGFILDLSSKQNRNAEFYE